MRAAEHLEGQDVRGRMTVLLGNIILADVPLHVHVSSSAASESQEAPRRLVTATPYRKIFASYSRKDKSIVEQFEFFAKTIGDRYSRDVNDLRSGEVWSDRLEEMIEEADVFQLFWSSNSMRSQYVRQEWEYALKLNRRNFIRPTFWEEPMPKDPSNSLPPEDLLRLHFQHFPVQITRAATPSGVTGSLIPNAAAIAVMVIFVTACLFLWGDMHPSVRDRESAVFPHSTSTMPMPMPTDDEVATSEPLVNAAPTPSPSITPEIVTARRSTPNIPPVRRRKPSTLIASPESETPAETVRLFAPFEENAGDFEVALQPKHSFARGNSQTAPSYYGQRIVTLGLRYEYALPDPTCRPSHGCGSSVASTAGLTAEAE